MGTKQETTLEFLKKKRQDWKDNFVMLLLKLKISEVNFKLLKLINKLWIRKQENSKQFVMKQEWKLKLNKEMLLRPKDLKRKLKNKQAYKEKKLNVNVLKECKILPNYHLLKVKFVPSKLNLLMNKVNHYKLQIKRERQKLIWLLLKEKLELPKLKSMKQKKIWNAKENAKQIARERWLQCSIKSFNLFYIFK